MGRPKTATAILDARGAFKANPQRKRDGEPVVSDPIPLTPPDHLTESEAQRWREIVRMAPAGVLTSADVITVEAVARLWAEWIDEGRDFPSAKIGHLRQALARIGLDPSGRASLVVSKPEANEFDDL